MHFIPDFPLGTVTVAAALEGIEIPHSFQQPVIVLLVPFQDLAKQGRRCNHAIWSLDDICTAFLLV